MLAGPNGTANDNLFALEPHRHGRIPVVLVHGTASSPLRWADMVNDLLEDKDIRDHYEFWFFTYNTGNPIPISANVLRHALENAVKSLGGVQADPALGRMVVIGHSQGGLLTKLISIDSGTKLWDAISDKPVDELNLKPETKAMLKEALFVHHLPFVETVIFIATPHGGSYQASLTIVSLFTRLVTLPLSIAAATADVLTNAGEALKLDKDRRTFNSINGMSPGNPAIEAMRQIPVAPGIHAHSIIPTLQDGPLNDRNDGVVEYKSAHIDGVESELVIEHQGHSTQSNPLAVREVRRILLERLPRRARKGARRRRQCRSPRLCLAGDRDGRSGTGSQSGAACWTPPHCDGGAMTVLLRLARWIGLTLLAVTLMVLGGWCALAIWFRLHRR